MKLFIVIAGILVIAVSSLASWGIATSVASSVHSTTQDAAAGADARDGSPGQNGTAGAPGATGAPGVAGARGATGATGSAGVTGAAGADGSASATGPQGPTGPPGPAGTNAVHTPPFVASSSGSLTIPADGSSAVMVSLTVPAGAYIDSVASGSITVSNIGPDDSVYCTTSFGAGTLDLYESGTTGQISGAYVLASTTPSTLEAVCYGRNNMGPPTPGIILTWVDVVLTAYPTA